MDENNSRLISETLWDEVKSLQRPRTVTFAAIAYYSKDLLHLKKGDTLVCDASDVSISLGKSSGKLLLKLHKKGVKSLRCIRRSPVLVVAFWSGQPMHP